MSMGDLRIEILTGSLNDKPIFRNLMQYYQYDTSEFTLEDPNPFGQFEYNYLDHYWTGQGVNSEGRVAYLVKVNDLLAGFALVNNFNIMMKTQNNSRTIAEFFIMRKWRRHGVGKYVAKYIFNTFQGLWEVKQEKHNTSAQHFWEAVVREYTNGNYTKTESHLPEWEGPVIRFNSKKTERLVKKPVTSPNTVFKHQRPAFAVHRFARASRRSDVRRTTLRTYPRRGRPLGLRFSGS